MKIEYLVTVDVDGENFSPVDMINIQDGIDSSLERDKSIGIIEKYSVRCVFARELDG